jgi:hypothetical protein
MVEDEVTPGEQEGDAIVEGRRGRSGAKQVVSDDEDAVRKPKARLLRGKKIIKDVIVGRSSTVILF